MLARRNFWLGAVVAGFAGLYLIGAAAQMSAGPPFDITPEPIPGKPSPARKIDRPRNGEIEYHLHPVYAHPKALHYLPSDGEDVSDWGHSLIDVPAAWKVATGKGVKVAVLDTGADHGHRDLKGRIVASKDFTNSRSGVADVHGHGTHCAGIVAAEKNGVGMVGVAPDAELLVAKVLSDYGSGSNTGIAAGIDWAVEQGADVISLSLGGPFPDDLTEAAIKRATAKGVIVVCAAGNDGPDADTIGYPAAYPECVAVAAVDASGKVANFSSRGPNVVIGAPGVNVRSCYPADRFATMSGTSMATPYVAGVAALYVQWCRDRKQAPSGEDFKARLKGGALDIAPPGRDPASGWGLVRPGKMFEAEPAPPPHDQKPDQIEIVLPGLMINGRPVKRLVIEFEPKK